MRFAPIFLSVLALAAGSTAAQTPEEILVESTPAATLPAKGMSKSGVVASYGEPARKHASVGGGSAHQPPITRWDYEGFVVVFENGHVVDAVQKGNPAPIKVRSGLSGGGTP